MCPPTGRGLWAHPHDSPSTPGRQPGRSVLRRLQSSLEPISGSEEPLRDTASWVHCNWADFPRRPPGLCVFSVLP